MIAESRHRLPMHRLSLRTNLKETTRRMAMKFMTQFITFSLLVASTVCADRISAAEAGQKTQTISRAGTQASIKGPAEYFTGNVRIDPLFPPNDSAPFSGAYVTFEPGARSAWHIHPTGQHLLVTAGVGRTGEWGGRVEEIKAGDVIWCPPKVKHWHGASPTTAMTHIAITGTINGKNVEWMEKVTDEQYNGK
jgi:quercetin dioxygenase-like cupin family protein